MFILMFILFDKKIIQYLDIIRNIDIKDIDCRLTSNFIICALIRNTY